MKPENSYRKRILSFKYAFKGIAYAFKSQPNMRIHGVIFFLVIAAGLFFRISTVDWLVIFLASGLVFSMEVLNTAAEFFLDKYYPRYSDEIGKIKDMTAGAVLVAAIFAAAAGLIIFIPEIMELL